MADTFQDGVSLYKMRNYRDALAVFLSVSASGNAAGNLDLAYYTGLSYARLKRYEDALSYLETVVTSETNTRRLNQCRLTLAVLYSKTDRTRLADTELEKLTENGYQTAEVFCARAYTAWMQDRKEQSVEFYLRALELKPDSATALNGLGYVLACMNQDLTKALSYCKRAVDSNPDSAAFLDSLGWVYYKMGLEKEAYTYIKRARDKDSTSREIAAHLAELSNAGIRGNN